MAFDRITCDPGRLNGQPCIRNLRLTVRRVLEGVAIYPDREELRQEYPELEDEDIRQAHRVCRCKPRRQDYPTQYNPMRVLLDQGLPRLAAKLLRDVGIDVIHTSECNLAAAADVDILDYARRQERVVVTLDADFHAIMVLGHATAPSVIRIRIEGLRAEAITDLVQAVFRDCGAELTKGALVSVTEDRIRVRCLPMH